MKEREAQGNGPWLYALDDPNKVLIVPLEFIAFRCFLHHIQQSTVRAYLAAINFSHKMFAVWEPPTSHCMIVAVGKWFDRAHGTAKKKIQLRVPLTRAVLAHGRKVVANTEDGGYAIG